MRIIAFDTETHLISAEAVTPQIVCGAFAERIDGEIQTELRGNHPDDCLEACIEELLDLSLAGKVCIITHNGSFDWTVVMKSFPRLVTKVWSVLEDGNCTDTLLREKLINLSTSGRLEKVRMPDGSHVPLLYSLADLEVKYLHIDRRAEKEGDDVWRLRYNELDGWVAADYPPEASEYAKADAEGTLRVFEAQKDFLEAPGSIASVETEQLRLAVSVALRKMTEYGIEVEPEQVAKMRKACEDTLEEVEPVLVEAGLLEPAQPARPHVRHAAKYADLKRTYPHWQQSDFEVQGIKFTEPTKAKLKRDPLQAYLKALYATLGAKPRHTDSGLIACDGEVQDFLAARDPIMAAYAFRAELSKIIGQQIPDLESGPVIHPNYDVLKETTRTSSYGNSKRSGRKPLYPSTQIQQVPGEIAGMDPRACYRPRAGRVFIDSDFTALELACVGQITKDLFGQSVHFDKYNAGYDLHGYLGAHLAVQQPGDFANACRAEGIVGDSEALYAAFMALKKHEDPEWRAFFKHWRTFAKPVGLGFPGGLGPATMVDFARKTYGVTMTEDQARDFREMWRETYPEMPRFFEWVNQQIDEHNVYIDEETGDQEPCYWYTTPMGAVRRGATFCAAANGMCMQSPGAEGATAAMFRVQRECYDPSLESILFGCNGILFLHDQVLVETTTDQSLWHDQAMRVKEIMCSSMRYALPDIKMRSDETHLTAVWSKKSQPVFGPDGRLIPWAPK